MILMLMFFGACAFIAYLCYIGTESREKTVKHANAFAGAFFSVIVSCIVFAIVLGTSYNSYLEIRSQYDATVNQYKGAVTMYKDHADLNLEKAAFTDFKYQGYQENLAAIIVDLRREIVSYNRMYVKKKTMNDNLFFNWLIIGPDENMKIINIVQ